MRYQVFSLSVVSRVYTPLEDSGHYQMINDTKKKYKSALEAILEGILVSRVGSHL